MTYQLHSQILYEYLPHLQPTSNSKDADSHAWDILTRKMGNQGEIHVKMSALGNATENEKGKLHFSGE